LLTCFQIFVNTVEDTIEDQKSESKTPLLSANLSYPTRPYVYNQKEDEQEQQLVYIKHVQPVEVINPCVRWHRRWCRSKAVDPSPTVGVYYTPFNMALGLWAMVLGDMECEKVFEQYRMYTHMVNREISFQIFSNE
jgi:hypothetical protein